MPTGGIARNDYKFGQYLIDCRKIDLKTLSLALAKQEMLNKAGDHKLLGKILLHDYAAFKDDDELDAHLGQFKAYKKRIEEIYAEARLYGRKVV